jgi:uncharacterized membrane protein
MSRADMQAISFTSGKLLGIAAVVIGYAVLANYTNQSGEASTLGALVAIAPVTLTILALAWRSAQRPLMLGLVVIAGGSLWLVWPVLKQHFGWIYWLEHESVQWLLLIAFGRTLLANRQPLCTQFAEIVHGPLLPRHARYARQVTIAWTIFFAGMIVISTCLFFIQPVAIWSIFANFIFLPLVGLMFIVEYAVRKFLLPDLDQANIMDAVRAFMHHSAQRP